MNVSTIENIDIVIKNLKAKKCTLKEIETLEASLLQKIRKVKLQLHLKNGFNELRELNKVKMGPKLKIEAASKYYKAEIKVTEKTYRKPAPEKSNDTKKTKKGPNVNHIGSIQKYNEKFKKSKGTPGNYGKLIYIKSKS